MEQKVFQVFIRASDDAQKVFVGLDSSRGGVKRVQV